MDRRAFLTSAVAGLTYPRFATAQIALDGGATLTTVSDGSLTLPKSFIFSPMPEEELAEIIADFGLTGDTLTPECNLALLQDGDRVVLFDAGAGPDFQPSAGQLLDALDAAGVSPEDITDLVLTHAHPDHIWGVLDDFGDPMFFNATHHIGAAELAYWTDPTTVDTIGEARAAFAAGALRRLDAIADLLQPFEAGDEPVAGVQSIPTPGHTPGHVAFQVADTLIVGDAIGNDHVAFARPHWPSGSDQDQAVAADTRAKLFDRITADDLRIVGFHLPGGGIGRVERLAEGYRFIQT